MAYERYVAIGDSSTEGLDDPDGQGGYRGWSTRLAERLARAQGSLLYANLAIRGLTTRQVRDQQLSAALDLRPDLVTLFVGTNDVVSRRFSVEAFRADLEAMQRALIEGGARVVGFTLPDLGPVMPLARLVKPRIDAMNAAYREVSSTTGAVLVPLDQHPVASDPRMWSEDRLHANSAGHERIAAALGEALGLPGCEGWSEPLPAVAPLSFLTMLGAELFWATRHLIPWACRQALGRSTGDELKPKRPDLFPLELDDPESAVPQGSR